VTAAHVQAAVQEHGTSVDAHLVLGLYYFRHHNFDEALAQFEQVRE
jgi:hypothetical protein